jgi:uncharacterized coiled-coil DUF342 family protein
MEQKLSAEAEKENRDSVRSAHVNIDMLMAEVRKTNTVTNIIETRLAGTAKGVQQNWDKCTEFAKEAAKLWEAQTTMKERIGDAEGVIKQLHEGGQQTLHKLEDAVRQVERNTDRLEQGLRELDDNNRSTDELRHQINGLRQLCDATTQRLNTLSADLKDVSQTAQRVRAGLKEQSSLLLPNIHVDSQEAQAASARHGTLLMSSTLGTRARV